MKRQTLMDMVGVSGPSQGQAAVFTDVRKSIPYCTRECQLRGGDDHSKDIMAARDFGQCSYEINPFGGTTPENIAQGAEQCLKELGSQCYLGHGGPSACPPNSCDPFHPCPAGFDCVNNGCVAKAGAYVPPEDESKTGLWVAGGIGAAIVLGLGAWLLAK